MGEGPLVLLLHGFPDTPRTWRLQMPALAAAGYRAVAVTLRGYEPSSQPRDGDFHVAALAQDVVDWADALGAQRAHLVGHDWGASIAYAAAALAPQRWLSLSTLAVPHPAAFAADLPSDKAQLQRIRYIMFFQLRGLSDWAIERKDWAYLERLWARWSPGWEWDPGDLQAMKIAFAQPGVKAAALSYYRQALDARSDAGKAGAALFARPIQVPTLGLTGQLDGCIGSDVFERCMPPALFPKGARVRRLAGVGHFLHLEQAQAVNALVLEFMGECTP